MTPRIRTSLAHAPSGMTADEMAAHREQAYRTAYREHRLVVIDLDDFRIAKGLRDMAEGWAIGRWGRAK